MSPFAFEKPSRLHPWWAAIRVEWTVPPKHSLRSGCLMAGMVTFVVVSATFVADGDEDVRGHFPRVWDGIKGNTVARCFGNVLGIAPAHVTLSTVCVYSIFGYSPIFELQRCGANQSPSRHPVMQFLDNQSALWSARWILAGWSVFRDLGTSVPLCFRFNSNYYSSTFI